MKLIVGLGNPGKDYLNTRHNIGWLILDTFAEKNKTEISKKKFESLVGEFTLNGEKVILLKPQTYMNLSGQAVTAAKNFYKLSVLDILVIHDDLDLPSGEIRFRQKGGSGGHNGLNSLIQELGTTEFARIKIGIGRPEDKTQVSDYVLSKLTKEEKEKIPYMSALEQISKWIGKS